MSENDQLPQLKELYMKLRDDAEEVIKDLATAQLIYKVVSIVMLVYGAVSFALGIASIILIVLSEVPLFGMSFPSMLVIIVIGIVLLIVGGRLSDKGEELEKKYGNFRELKNELKRMKG